MEPVYLSIENFMSHRKTEIDFTKFQTALIMGRFKSNPLESNGVGKTVFYNSIKWVLFGVYPTDTIDKIVRDETDFAKVYFDFKIDDKIYRIIRKRTLGKNTNTVLKEKRGNRWENISQKTPSETHKEILKLLKINVTSFENSCEFSQGSLDGLISNKGKKASPEDRRNILKSAADLTIYQKYDKAAKLEVDQISKEIDACKAVIDSLGNPEEEINNYKEKIKDLNDLLSAKEHDLDKIQTFIINHKNELSDLQQSISSEAVNVHGKLSELKTLKESAYRDIKKIRDSIISNSNEISSLEEKIKSKEKEVNSLQDNCDKARSKKRKDPNSVQKEIEATSQNELNGRAYINSLDQKVRELKAPIPDGEQCPTCKQSLTDEYKHACKESNQKELENILNKIADLQPKLKKVSNKKKRLISELEEIKSSLSYISNLESKIESKKQDIQNDNLYLDKIRNFADSQKKELSLLESKFNDLKEREASLEDFLEKNSNKEIESKIKGLKNKIIELESAKDVLAEEINNCKFELKLSNSRIEDKKKDLEKISKRADKLEELNTKLKIAKMSRRAFSNEIPTMIIHTLLDDLQNEANNLLSELKPGLEVQFTPDLDLKYKYYGRDRDFYQLSGGQKFIIALSLKLGLSLTIQKRAGINIKLLQLDEVDQPLDKAALETYAEAIQKLKNKFKILVITHNDELKDKFQDIIMVEGDHYNGATSKLVTI